MTSEKQKRNKLLELLADFEPPVVIFVNQKGGMLGFVCVFSVRLCVF
jgi:hypothetical protein